MFIARVVLVALSAAALSGCLMVEVFEYHITVDRAAGTATAESVYRNIESDHTDEQFDVDFNELIDNWKGDQYVRDRLREGVRVTDRRLTIEAGALVGRQVATFTDSSPGYRDFFVRDTVRLAFLARDIDSVTQTNGSVQKTSDSVIIVWPRHATDFRVSIKFRLPGPGVSFVPRFREYLASHKE